MKGIYHALNFFDAQGNEKILTAQCWIPVTNVKEVYEVLLYNSIDTSTDKDAKPLITELKTMEDPPTYFKLNKFTRAFQKIIEAYGVASYQEINPTLFTIITFPFLFAVMFGDLGHALIMTIFACSMIIKEDEFSQNKSENEIWKMLFAGRYVILLMGLFSCYTGMIYNDIFSAPMNIFGSQWRVNYNLSTIRENEYLQLNPASDDFQNLPYHFGLDPVWKLASNHIDRTNVLKMKTSIIFGVTQMEFGIFLSLLNHIHFRNYINIFCEFLPQLIFFNCLFVYLVVLIFLKWVTYGPKFDIKSSPFCAPSILISFIDMVLMKKLEAPDECDEEMYPNQNLVENIFLGIALTCIPWMLLLKPLILIRQIKRRKNMDNENLEGEIVIREDDKPAEIFIHQCIHTIEFVLGSVSYTASYLRLWALSLAHGQLSDVLWSRILHQGFISSEFLGGITVFMAFGVWAILTVSVLVVMEGLSAFLHALRLHWMEFQSKFYAGQGYYFEPFTFENIADEVDYLPVVYQ